MQLALCFAAIAISAVLAEKTGLFFAPFYILAGFLLGPGLLNLVSDTEVVSVLGEIGVVFLLFFLGLEFSLHAMLKKKMATLLAGFVDFFVNFGLGLGLGLLLGFPLFDCLVIAGAIYMSSSGIITKSLLELQVNKNPEGQLIMGIMVFEDLCMILFLAVLSAGATLGSDFQFMPMLVQLGKSLLVCAVIFLFARTGKHLLNRILNIRKAELLLIVFFGLVLLVTSLGEWLGVSAALCAFFLGMAFSGAENVKNIEHTTVILRDLFGRVFFFSFGMALSPGSVAGHGLFLLLCVLTAVVGKILSSFLITKIYHCQHSMSLFIGFITLPRGEFSLVVSGMPGVSVPFIGPVIVVMAFLTTLLSSLVLKFSKLLCRIYNICIIFPRSRLKTDTGEWGEVD
jgi:CPA2 family monovalent cation:H+ antiporter-2